MSEKQIKRERRRQRQIVESASLEVIRLFLEQVKNWSLWDRVKMALAIITKRAGMREK